ncbi:hypothetical protein [Mycobacterium intracellulare]|uniref:Uncharacterized protein n=1 Tax=Mycobacterium intracellulare TaxID=1767 RepID=A0A7R7MZN9_MYCIT|nr:hypothetical protein [Mycobacterium intracellulare]BCP02539.1 hypothetical protein MINTM018_53080 [Mycobacterium intracellulare]
MDIPLFPGAFAEMREDDAASSETDTVILSLHSRVPKEKLQPGVLEAMIEAFRTVVGGIDG